MITANGLRQLGFTSEIDFVLQNDGGDTYIREWLSNESQPTEKEITDAHVIWQAEYDANQYQRDRQYPSIGDQLDQLMKDMRDGTTTHKDACEAVKAKFPKPE